MRSVIKEAMSLKQFMVRTQVLQMYKSYMKLGRLLQAENEERTQKLKAEWTTWVRSEFRLRMHEKDEDIVRNLITIGKRQLGELERTIRISNS